MQPGADLTRRAATAGTNDRSGWLQRFEVGRARVGHAVLQRTTTACGAT
jgi:hypothetical protein